MFQTYTDSADASFGPARTAALRAEMARLDVHGFLIPRADEHQGEYVPPHAERLSWLSGFTGSAGLAIVLTKSAAVFIDGRYTLQVKQQVDLGTFQTHHMIELSATDWLAENLEAGQRLAYDPWLHTVDNVVRLKAAALKAGAELVALDQNPLDTVWEDQPARPLAPIVPHILEHSGQAASEKLASLTAGLKSNNIDATVLTMPDSIAWAFNIRGQDVGHSPLPLSFAVLNADGTAELFVDPRKLSDETRTHLGSAVTPRPETELGQALDDLGQNKKTVQLDPSSCANWIAARLTDAGANVKKGIDPCELPKACKNPVEVEGSRSAHTRDGIALSRFLHWLEVETPSGTVSEISASQQLESMRAQTNVLKDLSFDTISGAGPNGAIVHYRVTEATNRTLNQGELYLVDSGGQYLDGTTDVTRTVAIGTPSADMVRHFTLVLKGHISLANARFPDGTNGAQIDILARQALWSAGLDFDHGTGHGVGSYLSVHEGPQRISKMGYEPFQTGMIVSNEPGFYKTDAYGIRIENLMVVTEPTAIENGERLMRGFETLTLAPIDLNLVDAQLLSDTEIEWLNAYHARVRQTVEPQIPEDEKQWLENATRPISK